MKKEIVIMLLGGALFAGCGDDDVKGSDLPPIDAAADERSAAAEEAMEAEEKKEAIAEFEAELAAAMPELPATTPGAPVTAQAALGEYGQDDEGNNIDLLTALNNAMVELELKRTYWMENEIPIPPITNVQQLVQYRVVRAVPAPPAGKQYKVDPKTLKVTIE